MQLLNEILIIFGLATAVLFLCHRLKMPTIVGLLLTGVLAGPHGLGLISAVHEVEILAEIGVVLLLFTIGIEFSFKSLLQIKKAVLLGGSLQVVLTLLAGFALSRLIERPFGQAVFIGFLVSLSSTAIVLKLLQERAEVDSPQGKIAVGILIYQDIIVVPMMLLTPLLAGSTENFSQSLLVLLAKGIGVILFVIISAKWIVPNILYQIARTRSRELFLLSIIAIAFAVAWLTLIAGLSLALGAFLAGLAISESEYSHQAFGNIIPLRDVFTSFFFISIGMLLDVTFLFQKPGLLLLVALIVLVLKTLIAGFTTTLLGFPLRTAILVGAALSQIGEFSFILSKTGLQYEIFTKDVYQPFLAVTVLTMGATPFIINAGNRVAERISRLPLPKRLILGLFPGSIKSSHQGKKHLKDHLIIIGFGVNGRNVAKSAKVAGIPYIIIEMNPETVRKEFAKSEPIYYGDAIHEHNLEHADIKEARILVAAISDPVAIRNLTATARRLNPRIHIIVRTRFLQEMKPLYDLGADEVIPEEFETSVEIFTRVLNKYLIPKDQIERFVAEVRADGYEMFRSLSSAAATLSNLKIHLPDVEISTLRIGRESPAIGKSLAQVELRKKYGVTLLAVRRGAQTVTNPDGNFKFGADDVIVVLGRPQLITEAMHLFYDAEKEQSDL